MKFIKKTTNNSNNQVYLDVIFNRAFDIVKRYSSQLNRLIPENTKPASKVVATQLKKDIIVGLDLISGSCDSSLSFCEIIKDQETIPEPNLVNFHIGKLIRLLHNNSSGVTLNDDDLIFVKRFCGIIKTLFKLIGRKFNDLSREDRILPSSADFSIIQKQNQIYFEFKAKNKFNKIYFTTERVLSKYIEYLLLIFEYLNRNDLLIIEYNILKLYISVPNDFNTCKRLALFEALDRLSLTSFLIIQQDVCLVNTSRVFGREEKISDKVSNTLVVDLTKSILNTSLVECDTKGTIRLKEWHEYDTIRLDEMTIKLLDVIYSLVHTQQQNEDEALLRNAIKIAMVNTQPNDAINGQVESVLGKTSLKIFDNLLVNLNKINEKCEKNEHICSVWETFKAIDFKEAKNINKLIIHVNNLVQLKLFYSLIKQISKVPMEIVFINQSYPSIGAAYFGLVKSINSKMLPSLSNTLLYNIGISLYNGILFAILQTQTRLPTQNKYLLKTVADNQQMISVFLYEGNYKLIRNCRLIYEILISDLPKHSKAGLKCELILKCDRNCVLTVRATDPDVAKDYTVNYMYVDQLDFKNFKAKQDDLKLYEKLVSLDEYIDELQVLSRKNELLRKKINQARNYLGKNRFTIKSEDCDLLKEELDEVARGEASYEKIAIKKSKKFETRSHHSFKSVETSALKQENQESPKKPKEPMRKSSTCVLL
jgi:hypothetical protein